MQKNIDNFIRYYNPVLHTMLFIIGFCVLFLIPWYFILVAFLISNVASVIILGTIYHKMWCHQSFEPKPWVNYIGPYLGFVWFCPLPTQFVVTHTLHHIDPEDIRHPLCPKHPVKYKLFPWIYASKFKFAPDYQKAAKEVKNQFLLKNPWANKINLEKRLLTIHISYLLFYFIDPTLFAVMILSAAFLQARASLSNAFTHWYDKNGNPQTLNSPLLAILMWDDRAYHKEHHEHPERYALGVDGPLGKFGPHLTSKFLVRLLRK